MRRIFASVLGGIIVLVLGGLVLASELFNFHINFFFDGWWTFFIIIPCFINMIRRGINAGNAIGFSIGAILFLNAQNFLHDISVMKIIIAIIFVVIGLSLIIKAIFSKNKANVYENAANFSGAVPPEASYQNCSAPTYSAFFSGQEIKFPNTYFKGATISSIFGGVELDLRNAVFEGNCVINATCIFGGVDIFVPSGVRVIVSSTPIFGGVSNKTFADETAPTIFLNAVCTFGGIDVK